MVLIRRYRAVVLCGYAVSLVVPSICERLYLLLCLSDRIGTQIANMTSLINDVMGERLIFGERSRILKCLKMFLIQKRLHGVLIVSRIDTLFLIRIACVQPVLPCAKYRWALYHILIMSLEIFEDAFIPAVAFQYKKMLINILNAVKPCHATFMLL